MGNKRDMVYLADKLIPKHHIQYPGVVQHDIHMIVTQRLRKRLGTGGICEIICFFIMGKHDPLCAFREGIIDFGGGIVGENNDRIAHGSKKQTQIAHNPLGTAVGTGMIISANDFCFFFGCLQGIRSAQIPGDFIFVVPVISGQHTDDLDRIPFFKHQVKGFSLFRVGNFIA